MKNYPVLLLVIVCLWSCNQANQKLDNNESVKVFTALKAPSQLMYADIDPFISVNKMSVNEVKGLLKKMLAADQQYRDSLHNGRQDRMKFYDKKISGNDEANLLILDKIVQKFGWPGIDLFGEERANTAWLIIWHHRDKRHILCKYHSLMEEAVRNKQMHSSALENINEQIALLSSDQIDY